MALCLMILLTYLLSTVLQRMTFNGSLVGISHVEDLITKLVNRPNYCKETVDSKFKPYHTKQ